MSPAAESAAPAPILLSDLNEGILTLTLNRPDQYNALSDEMLDRLQQALDEAESDDRVRVVVLAAAGKAYCAGHDLKQMRANPSRDYYEALFAKCSRIMSGIVRLSKPVIARVHGVATAAGCQLVASCDLAVASTDAGFAESGIRVGLFCSTPSVALSRNVTRKHAFEMLITGEFVDAATAVEFGLVNRAVAPETLDATVRELADSIIAKSPVAVGIGKRMFYRQIEMGLEAAYAYAGAEMAGNMMAEDAAEGIDAFIEKRAPEWKGR